MSERPRRVTGLGGIFFKAEDPTRMNQWYAEHLGLKTGEYGTNFHWLSASDGKRPGFTVWAPFAKDTDYFEPSKQPFMINFRVDDIEAVVSALKDEGVEVVGEIQSFDYGKFAHVLDPEGNKIELFEPIDGKYLELLDSEPGSVTET